MKVAIVGPPQSGKSTLFQAITGIAPDPHKYHGATPQPGVVDVPDPRLDDLTARYEPQKRVPATLELLDFAGVALDERSEHTRQLLANIRDGDALLIVLGAFAGRDIAADLRKFRDELLFTDLEQITKRIDKLEKSFLKPSKTLDQDKRELAALKKIIGELEETESWAGVRLDEADEKILRGFRFLSRKPSMVVVNVDEAAIADDHGRPVAAALGEEGAIALCAPVERDVAELDPEERGEFLEAFGIDEPARAALIHSTYRACGLASFFTVGPDECRAWTIHEGDDAVTAASKIHTDLARGFIRAEVFTYDDVVAHGEEKNIKAAGKHRLEGKDYIVRDGDILNIRSGI